MPDFSDLYGRPLEEGTPVRLSGGYADINRPDYLIHAEAVVVGFGRTRVRVRLTGPEYQNRELNVLPMTCVAE